MANEYAQLATLKLSLGMEADDDSRDDLLNNALASASRSIDTACGRRFYLDAAPSARVFNPSGRVVCDDSGERLLLDDMGAAPTLVETGSGGVWTAVTDYEAGPDNALVRGRPLTSLLRTSSSWGRGTVRVRVTDRWGWPAVPDEIEQASLIQASRLFKRKDSPEGVTGSAEWGVVRLSRRDPDVWALIEHYVIPGFG
ncbi:phage head-tail connector protein [Streptomyces stelliscabiei]|uniref:phage head-tail connector protein n=1 Tax=Streptomyces stelliscabiei TaxID=146820 RepID=UPI0029B2E642|nr:phage head-tail connector protein [Streptomyces stelliscabiei]MDX2552755.1 phage head-tail connector protein [Streptomyces stelliscabiei]